jgi:hypothetical protein
VSYAVLIIKKNNNAGCSCSAVFIFLVRYIIHCKCCGFVVVFCMIFVSVGINLHLKYKVNYILKLTKPKDVILIHILQINRWQLGLIELFNKNNLNKYFKNGSLVIGQWVTGHGSLVNGFSLPNFCNLTRVFSLTVMNHFCKLLVCYGYIYVLLNF